MPQEITINVNVPVDTWNKGCQILGPGFLPRSGDIKYTPAKLNLAAPSPKGGEPHFRDFVTLSGEETARNITVRGDVKITFRFPDPADGPVYSGHAGFRPIGIGFYTENAGINSYLTDLNDPPDYKLEPKKNGAAFAVPTVTVRNRYEKKGEGAKFKYMIFIQDCYGNVGIIDPDIENDADPA